MTMMVGLRYAVPIVVSALFLIPVQDIFAQYPNFTRFDSSDEIAKNPTAQKILQQIELSKKILKDLKSGTIRTEQTEQQRFVEEQRKITKEQLQQDLDKMHKDYEGFTPKNAYAKFLNRIPSQYHELYWEEFNHLDKKIHAARDARDQVLASGGTYEDAMYEFHKHATTQRIELVQINRDVNIKHGFTDTEFQSYFDNNGKLPRYENEDPQPCFSCKRYEPIAQKIIDDALVKTSNTQSANATKTT